MTEAGCVVTVEMKFRFQTDFLDRVFISQGIIQEGETRMDAILRVNKELEETAARLRKEAIPSFHQEGGQPAPGIRYYTPEQLAGATPYSVNGQVIDYKKIEQFERDIDNAKTSEELEAVVKSVETFPGRLLSTINAKRQLFKTNESKVGGKTNGI